MDPIQDKMKVASAQTIGSSSPRQGTSTGGSKKSFKDVMSAKVGESSADSAGQNGSTPRARVDKAENSEMAQRVDKFVKDIGEDQKRIDRMMARLSRGGELSQAELLRVQSTTYRYAQRVDLATKVVEKTANGVKQMMNTQV